MKFTINTIKLQDMVAKAVKGASSNKMIPITGLIAIELDKNVLTLTTTDATNVLKVIEKDVTGDEFYAVLQADIFSKLIAKTTSETVTLTIKESGLEVKGNGTYTIELPIDEEGNPIKFRDYKFNLDAPKSSVNLTTIKTLLTANKAALAETMEIPCLTGYYFYPEGVLTTDTFKVCGTEIPVFDRPLLLSAELVELLSVMTEEKITVQEDGDRILFTTPNVIVFGYELEEVEEYPAEAIGSYLESEFESVCKLPKAPLLSVLDRLSLFVTPYDKNGLYLTFTNEGLMINSKKSNGTELIKYEGSTNFKPYTCCGDIELLRSQVNATIGDTIELWYGHDKALKLTSGKITQIVALLEDDRIANGEEA